MSKQRVDYETMVGLVNRSPTTVHLGEPASMLARLFPFEDHVGYWEREDIALSVARKLYAKRPATADDLASAMHREQNRVLSLPVRPFVVCAGLMTRRTRLEFPVRESIAGCRVMIGDLPERFMTVARARVQELASLFDGVSSQFYFPVLVLVFDRTPSKSAERGMAAFDLLRAMWNYGASRVQRPGSGAESFRVVNRLLRYPAWTVHLRDGELADHVLWREEVLAEREFAGGTSNQQAEKDGKRAAATVARLLEGLQEHPYEEVLSAALVRYVHALDGSDPDLCFLRLWALLEFLTGTRKHEDVVNRVWALWPEHDHAYQSLLLSSLREARNGLVHRSAAVSSSAWAVYQAKECAEVLLDFHLAEGRQLGSLEQGGALLSLLASSPGMLERKVDQQETDLRITRAALQRRRASSRVEGSK